jgi:gluconolactonase
MFNRIASPTAPSSGYGPALWAEGPAWSGQGRYLVSSDIPTTGDAVGRGHRPRERVPHAVNNSNGNTFDFRAASSPATPDARVYEHDGSITILAESFEGKRLNSRVTSPHPDRSYWFTDPPWGAALRARRMPRAGRAIRLAGSEPPGPGGGNRQHASCRPTAGSIEREDRLVVTEQQVPDRTGSASRPTTSSTSPAPARVRAIPARRQGRHPRLRRQGDKLSNPKLFSDCMVDGVMRAGRAAPDVDGNVWASSNAGRRPTAASSCSRPRRR